MSEPERLMSREHDGSESTHALREPESFSFDRLESPSAKAHIGREHGGWRIRRRNVFVQIL
jgi:hypothetical protein